jgi:hypothetical protein
MWVDWGRLALRHQGISAWRGKQLNVERDDWMFSAFAGRKSLGLAGWMTFASGRRSTKASVIGNPARFSAFFRSRQCEQRR